MVLLSELFCSCFKWLIQIKHRILFLVQAAAALSEAGCFSQQHPSPGQSSRSPQRRHRHPAAPRERICLSTAAYCWVTPLGMHAGCILLVIHSVHSLHLCVAACQRRAFPLKAAISSNFRAVTFQEPFQGGEDCGDGNRSQG